MRHRAGAILVLSVVTTAGVDPLQVSGAADSEGKISATFQNIDISAERVTSLSVGARARASAPAVAAAPVVGEISKLSHDAIELIVSARESPVVLPRTSLTRLEVSTGRNRRRGALLGLGIGVVGGATVGAVGCRDSSDWSSSACAAILGGFSGAVGAGLGALFAAGDHWAELPVGRFQLAVAPTRSPGLGLTMRLAF
jgi:hypothetical protein